MDEYLEKLFADAYKRELEQEESIVRSLPFIAALAGVALLALREFAGVIPAFDGSWRAFAVHGLLVGIGLTFAYVVFHLFLAVGRRGYQYTKDEVAIRRTADELLDFYQSEGLPAEEAERYARQELRAAMIEQWASCASNNRRQNAKRQVASGRAFNGLIAALALALLFIGTTYIMSIIEKADGPLDAPALNGADGDGHSVDP